MYTGRENNEVQRYLGRKVVLSVLRPYLDKGVRAFMDKYYTSVALFQELEDRKTLACGTMWSNRVRLPKEICELQEKCVKELERGDSLYRQKGRLTCVTWRDRKPVRFLAAIPTSETHSTVIQ